MTAGIDCELIIEDDHPFTGQAMAIGIVPGDRSMLKRFLSHLPLVRGDSLKAERQE